MSTKTIQLLGNIPKTPEDIGAAAAEHTHDSLIEQNNQAAQKFWVGIKSEYDAIPVKDNDTIYIVTDDAGKGIDVVYALSIHASQHASGGSDPITLDMIGAAAAEHTHDSIIEQNNQTVQKFWVGTKSEYDALDNTSPDVMYFIEDDVL